MKKILYVIIALVVVYLGLCAAGPSEIKVSRSMEMGHSSEIIFKQVNAFQNWENWSPWFDLDPNATYEYKRGSGEGSSAIWKSKEPMVGNGKQTIIKSSPNKSVLIDLNFEGKGSANAYFEITEIDTETSNVEWGFYMSMPFLQRAFGLFVDFEKEMAPTFERGLNNLNNYLNTEDFLISEDIEDYVEEEVLEEKSEILKTTTELSPAASEKNDVQLKETKEIKEEDIKSTEEQETEAQFIMADVGTEIAPSKDNDLMNRAFEDVSLIKKGEGKCSLKNMGNDVVIKNNNASEVILVRVSVAWKDLEKEKHFEFKEYNIQPSEELFVGCVLVYPNGKAKGKWSIIHTEYR
ncbi:MAG: SRPBCC family protein [Salibacteraceae bacterium]